MIFQRHGKRAMVAIRLRSRSSYSGSLVSAVLHPVIQHTKWQLASVNLKEICWVHEWHRVFLMCVHGAELLQNMSK